MLFVLAGALFFQCSFLPLVSIATDGVAAVLASEFGSGCQGDGAVAVSDLFCAGGCSLFVLKTIVTLLASLIRQVFNINANLGFYTSQP